MGFKGSESNIEILGEMVTKTGGQVDLVDPAQVNKNFQSIFSDDTIARDVNVKIYLPRGITLKKNMLSDWQIYQKEPNSQNKDVEDSIPEINGGKIFCKQFGSVNSDSNVLIQFQIDPSFNEEVQAVPFQIQINYTRVEDGKRLMRVISRVLPTSTKQLEADRTADLEVMGLNAVRTVALTAQNGSYTKARLENFAQLQLMKRLAKAATNSEEANEVLKSYAQHNLKFEEKIYREQLSEIYKGEKWDETEEEMKVLSEKLPERHQVPDSGFTLPDVFSGVSSFLSSWLGSSSTTTTTTTTTSTSSPSWSSFLPSIGASSEITQQRATRGDEVSNMLWNMRGANML